MFGRLGGRQRSKIAEFYLFALVHGFVQYVAKSPRKNLGIVFTTTRPVLPVFYLENRTKLELFTATPHPPYSVS